jgi:type IV pilus assembly protein PilQ
LHKKGGRAKILQYAGKITMFEIAKKKLLRHSILVIILLLCLPLYTVPLFNCLDWLVTKSNRKIEVQSYSIEGEMVIIHLKNGKLAQIPAEDIDWESSEKLNQSNNEDVEAEQEYNAINSQNQAFEAKLIDGEKKNYRGKPINLEFKDADIRDILHIFSEVSGLNFVIDPQVTGKTTIWLNEVPWDQALELILKNNGLGMVAEGNVYRVAPVQKLIEEEAAQRNLAEQQYLARPLVTMVRTLSYARAEELAKIIEKFLSPRGSVLVDERSNTLIITDIPEIIGEIESQLPIQKR